MTGWLIYKIPEAERNSRYIEFYKQTGEAMGISIELLLYEHFIYDKEKKPSLLYEGRQIVKKPDFVIMRAVVPDFSEHLEKMGFFVCNNAHLSRIANDKEKTLRLAQTHGIPIPKTAFATCETAIDAAQKLGYPLVIKPPDGHGGKDVCMVEDEAALLSILSWYPHPRFLLQRLVSELGKDLRVYVIGNQILVAMLRESTEDFRSNFCLGGTAKQYTLSETERQLVEQVIALFDVDYAGFDFMFDNGQMVLNEIEDVVGARMLYSLTDIDVVRLYLQHILKKLRHH